MRIIVLSVALTLAACSPPAPAKTETPPPTESASATVPAPPAQGVSFQAPSGNIGCNYTPAGGTAVYQTADGRAELQCDRVEPSYLRITLPESGAAHVTPTDERGCCGGETIAYGETWNDGPFVCEMRESSLVCTSRDGHGFVLSRSQQDVH